MYTNDQATRRRVLAGLAAGTGLLAGCVGDDENDDENGTAGENEEETENGTEEEGDEEETENGTEEEGDGEETAEVAAGATPPVLGDPDADVTLEVYADLGCPGCAAYNDQVFPDIEATYLDDGRIRYEHREFVVTGEAAGRAANAAREVFERHGPDEFWAFTSAVYEQRARLRTDVPELFDEIATDLGLDAEAIATAGADRTHQSTVEADIDRGQDLGVTAVPGFVLDGELVEHDAESFDELVDALTATLDDALDDAESGPEY